MAPVPLIALRRLLVAVSARVGKKNTRLIAFGFNYFSVSVFTVRGVGEKLRPSLVYSRVFEISGEWLFLFLSVRWERRAAKRQRGREPRTTLSLRVCVFIKTRKTILTRWNSL